jgi:hypothetical protein
MIEKLNAKYLHLCRAMQAGVAAMMNYESRPTEPKHLRVGVNTALSDHGALVKLLIDKKLITEEEYLTSITQFMQQEVTNYEQMLSRHTGGTIKLGGTLEDLQL